MSQIQDLINSNIEWSDKVKQKNPVFFSDLAKKQKPKYLWIGCSDSRVPTNTLLGRKPGEVFVHRNIANVVSESDLSCTSVVQFAVDHLKVTDIIIAGHYGCGGIESSITNEACGNLNTWLDKIRDVVIKHENLLESLPQKKRLPLLCVLNALEQSLNLCNLETTQNAWQRQQNLTVHCLMYNIRNGLLESTPFKVSANTEIDVAYTNTMDYCTNKDFSGSII